MKAFNVILGAFALFAAPYCLVFPGRTFLNTGWVVAILLAVWGICAVFDFFSNMKSKPRSKSELVLGIIGIICGVGAAVVALLGIFMAPLFTVFMVDLIMLYMFCLWLFLSGIDSVFASIKMKKEGKSKWWILTLVMGILILLGALYGCFHGVFLAQLAGYFVGYGLVVYGVRLISSAFEGNE